MRDTTRELYDSLSEDRKRLVDDLIVALQETDERADEYLTVAQASEEFGVPAQTLYRAVRQGYVRSTTPRGQSKPKYVTRDSMRAWLYGVS